MRVDETVVEIRTGKPFAQSSSAATSATAGESAANATPKHTNDMAVLLDCLQQALELPNIDRSTCGWLQEKLRGDSFHLVVAGQFKRGKSSLINALLGAPILPVAVVPLTSIVTVIRYGPQPKAHIEFQDGRGLDVAIEALSDYATERGNPRNSKRVAQVTAEYPSPWLADGVRVVDTPGIGSVYEHNTEVTRAYLPRADLVLFILSVDQPVSRDELEFLRTIREYAGKVICVLNKSDYLSASELAESIAFSQQTLHDVLGTAIPLYPVSAKQALAAKQANPNVREAVSLGGFGAFEQALRAFFAGERRATWLQAIARSLKRILIQARFTTQLELDAMTAPLERLDQALELLRIRGAAIRQTQEDAGVLLERAAMRLLSEQVEPRLRDFQAHQTPKLLAFIDATARAQHTLGCGALQTLLQQQLLAELRRLCDSWRAQEEQALAQAFDAACGRFWRALQQHLDELLQACAELFNLSFEPITEDSAWRSESRFYYKFWSEPPTLRLVSEALVRLLPPPIGRAMIVRRARATAVELLEGHVGRLRADLSERLHLSAHEFQRHLAAVARALLVQLDQTLQAARTLRTASQSENLKRQELLRRRLGLLTVTEGRLPALAP
jgi:GTP-binding protein EngB required for normal cell division